MPLNYWLEYLDLVFFFKYLHGHVDLTGSFNFYFSFVASQTHQACSGLNLKINNNHTSTFRDYYIPNDVRLAESIDSFKRKLKSFYFKRLFNVFDGDNFRTFKIICPKCRRVNTLTACVHLLSSLFSLIILLSLNFRRGLGWCLNLVGDLCPIIFAPVLLVQILK